MPRMRPMAIYLTDVEKMELEQILRRHSSGQQLVPPKTLISTSKSEMLQPSTSRL
jgi:hypothetical protein